MNNDIQKKLDQAHTLASENVKRAASGIKQGAEQVAKRARTVTSQASQQVDSAKLHAGKAVDHANRLITEHPFAATAAAVAAGAVAAWLFPKTARKLKNATPRLIDAASETGRDSLAAARKGIKLPIEGAGQLASSVGDAARKTPEALSGAAKAALDHARVIAGEITKRAERDTKAGLENVRSIAAQATERLESEARAGLHAAREAVQHIDIAEVEKQANKFASVATEAAASVAKKIRSRGQAPTNEGD